MIGVCIPSRGLVHSRTVESILRNVQSFIKSAVYGVNWFIVFSHDKPIPDSHNYVVQEALSQHAAYIWMVEEDNVIPDGYLGRMVEEMDKGVYEVIAVDYPVGEKRYSTIKKENGKILWCGFGCTLIKRAVFERLSYPWFETGRSLRIYPDGKRELVNVSNKYGGHDILFGLKLQEIGGTIGQLEGQVDHLRLVEEGRKGYNDGFHHIEEMGAILHAQ